MGDENMEEDTGIIEAPKTTLESLKSESLLKVMPKERKDALKKAIGPKYKNITDAELELFAMIAVRYDLDPFIKEIFFTKQKGAVVPITGRDGFLKIAKKDPGYDGLESYSICANDEFRFDAGTGEISHIIAFGDRGEVKGAWARAYHKHRKPAVAYVNFDEYDKGVLSDAWKDYPSAMIQKVAESYVLRRQFSINGIVGAEEIGADTNSKVAGIQVPNFSDPIYESKEEVVEGEFTIKEGASEPRTDAGMDAHQQEQKQSRKMGEVEAKIQADKISKQLKKEEIEQDKILDNLDTEEGIKEAADQIREELVSEGGIPKSKVELPPRPTQEKVIKKRSIKEELAKAKEIEEAEKLFPSVTSEEIQEQKEEEMPSLDDLDVEEEESAPEPNMESIENIKDPLLKKIIEKHQRKNDKLPSPDTLREELERHREAGISVKDYMRAIRVLNTL